MPAREYATRRPKLVTYATSIHWKTSFESRVVWGGDEQTVFSRWT